MTVLNEVERKLGIQKEKTRELTNNREVEVYRENIKDIVKNQIETAKEIKNLGMELLSSKEEAILARLNETISVYFSACEEITYMCTEIAKNAKSKDEIDEAKNLMEKVYNTTKFFTGAKNGKNEKNNPFFEAIQNEKNKDDGIFKCEEYDKKEIALAYEKLNNAF